MLTVQQLTVLKKQEIIDLYLEKQEECMKLQELSNSLKSLEERFFQLESHLKITKNTSDLLFQKVKTLEKDLLTTQQYSRRECLEFNGIDKAIDGGGDLERAIQDVLNDIDVEVSDTDIQACHRIGNRGTVIVKFTNRKKVSSIFRNKKALQDRPGPTIYINESLCSTNRKLRGCCNALKKQNLINKIRTKNGMVQVQVQQHGHFITIDHKDVLIENFPGFNFRFEN